MQVETRARIRLHLLLHGAELLIESLLLARHVVVAFRETFALVIVIVFPVLPVVIAVLVSTAYTFYLKGEKRKAKEAAKAAASA